MNHDKQRIAIAEARGFRNIHESDGIWFGTAQDSELESTWPLPDYLHDLNAINEAVRTLPPDVHWKFINHLTALAPIFSDDCTSLHWFICNATAAQRAKAFLRTIGKWEDGE